MLENEALEMEDLPVEVEYSDPAIIKVMGVGGGGCNAVNHMFQKGIKDVSFLVCNTDQQALGKMLVPYKLQLGPGRGAGGRPEVASKYAEESAEEIKKALNDGTKMLFITAGMGGGTGTGASPIIAKVAREMDILTVGIVTLPFEFEGQPKFDKAMTGLKAVAEQVDAILVIYNERLKSLYPDDFLKDAFGIADDVLSDAAKSMAEIVTVPGYINTDFADVYNTLKDGRVAIMNVGEAEGEERIAHAIDNALKSPLANNTNVKGASRILLQLYAPSSLKTDELSQVHQFIKSVGNTIEVAWGVTFDDSLDEKVRVTLVATGYPIESIDDVVKQVTTAETPKHTITRELDVKDFEDDIDDFEDETDVRQHRENVPSYIRRNANRR